MRGHPTPDAAGASTGAGRLGAGREPPPAMLAPNVYEGGRRPALAGFHPPTQVRAGFVCSSFAAAEPQAPFASTSQ